MKILNTAFIAVILSSLAACSGNSDNGRTTDGSNDSMSNPTTDAPQSPPTAMGFTELTRDLLDTPASADAKDVGEVDLEIEMDIDANDDPIAFDDELATGS